MDGSSVPAENRESPSGRSEVASGRPGFLENIPRSAGAGPADPAHPTLEASGILALPQLQVPVSRRSGKG